MEFLSNIILIVQILLLIWLGGAALYLLLFSIYGHFSKNAELIDIPVEFPRIAVMIPAYKEDAVIVEVAKSASEQSYPEGRFEIVVIADSLQDTTIEKLKALDIRVVEVSFEKSTKAKALNHALEVCDGDFDTVVVLDADNVMSPGFLIKVGIQMGGNCKALQCHRTAKNSETDYARLDAISEEVNNHIFCVGHRVVGLSSRLIGSGMAFDYQMFKDYMNQIDAVGGFDKDLELRIMKDGIKIHYESHAHVYDEKVSKSQVYSSQRKRWISAQYHYLGKSIGPAFKALITTGNIDYFNKAWQFTLPPRIVVPGVSFILALLNVAFGSWAMATVWASVFVGFGLAYALSIPRNMWTKSLLKTALKVPAAFLLMVKVMFKLKGANNTFIHTPHGATGEK